MNERRESRATDGEPRRGVLVVGHGTRSAGGIAEFRAVVEQLAARLAPLHVEPCFLELAEPTIAAGLERLHARGTEQIVVAPLLLFAAGHAKEDIPAAVAGSPTVTKHGLRWTQAEPLGLHPRIVELSVLRFTEAVAALPEPDPNAPIAADETLLVLVGRGAKDAEAIAEFEKFAALRKSATAAAAAPLGGLEIAYTALAEPLVEALLPRVAAGRHRRIVVQPHLLFTGELIQRLHRQVQEAAVTAPTKQWTTTAHLGSHPLVVEALADRIAAAGER